jgi:hypothetical protein
MRTPKTTDFGTADYVSEIETFRRVEWGGFAAELAYSPDADQFCGTIFLCAVAWRGAQPRMVLRRGDAGYRDWARLLAGAPVERRIIRFVGSHHAARNVEDQWLTHGPSDLLAHETSDLLSR